MRLPRAINALLLSLLLLFVQQVGATHILWHALVGQDQQHDKHVPHSPACGYCSAYVQMGGALVSVFHLFTDIDISGGIVLFVTIALRLSHPLTAFARGPPGILREIPQAVPFKTCSLIYFEELLNLITSFYGTGGNRIICN